MRLSKKARSEKVQAATQRHILDIVVLESLAYGDPARAGMTREIATAVAIETGCTYQTAVRHVVKVLRQLRQQR